VTKVPFGGLAEPGRDQVRHSECSLHDWECRWNIHRGEITVVDSKAKVAPSLQARFVRASSSPVRSVCAIAIIITVGRDSPKTSMVAGSWARSSRLMLDALHAMRQAATPGGAHRWRGRVAHN